MDAHQVDAPRSRRLSPSPDRTLEAPPSINMMRSKRLSGAKRPAEYQLPENISTSDKICAKGEDQGNQIRSMGQVVTNRGDFNVAVTTA